MDILYIIGENRSKCNYNELRYSLRSIEQYGENVGRIFVAGCCPDFLSDEVIKVPCDQPYHYDSSENELTLTEKHINILYTILYVLDHTDISDEFLVSMDDHIYIRNVDFDNYPFYVKKFGDKNELPSKGKSVYKKLLAKTREELEKQGLSVYYSTLHRNMHGSRAIYEECRDYLNQVILEKIPLEPHAFTINYRFTKKGDFEFKPVKDVKLNGGGDWWMVNPSKTECFSTSDFEPGIGLDCLMNGMFNKKSKYEK